MVCAGAKGSLFRNHGLEGAIPLGLGMRAPVAAELALHQFQHLVSENVLEPVAATHDVVARARVLDSHFSRH